MGALYQSNTHFRCLYFTCKFYRAVHFIWLVRFVCAVWLFYLMSYDLLFCNAHIGHILLYFCIYRCWHLCNKKYISVLFVGFFLEVEGVCGVGCHGSQNRHWLCCVFLVLWEISQQLWSGFTSLYPKLGADLHPVPFQCRAHRRLVRLRMGWAGIEPAVRIILRTTDNVSIMLVLVSVEQQLSKQSSIKPCRTLIKKVGKINDFNPWTLYRVRNHIL